VSDKAISNPFGVIRVGGSISAAGGHSKMDHLLFRDNLRHKQELAHSEELRLLKVAHAFDILDSMAYFMKETGDHVKYDAIQMVIGILQEDTLASWGNK
jgi:hypothetical protein